MLLGKWGWNKTQRFLLQPESTNTDQEAKCIFMHDMAVQHPHLYHTCMCVLKLCWYKMHDQRRELLTDWGCSASFWWTTEGAGSLKTWRDAVTSAPSGFTALRCVKPASAVTSWLCHYVAFISLPRWGETMEGGVSSSVLLKYTLWKAKYFWSCFSTFFKLLQADDIRWGSEHEDIFNV